MKGNYPALDFDRMERELMATPLPPPPRLEHSETAVQIIAQGITHLTWKDAESMGKAIQAEMKDGESLTSAIQAWAQKWESFK